MSDAPRRVPPRVPPRVRVSADPSPPRGPGIRRPVTRSVPVPASASPGAFDEADAVYDRALRRSQLRLALGAVAGFVVVVVALTLAVALIPELDRWTLAGVPVSWLLHAFAFYPAIVVFAVLYTRGATRNERRYRTLRERE
ncbi:heavy metal transporter [Microbacterium aurum]